MTAAYLKSIVPPSDFTLLARSDLAGSIPDRFNQIAARYIEKPAVCDHANSLSYRDLQGLVGKTAATIQRAIGHPGPARGVGLIFDPTVESVAGILGVLASGNFFCPISPRDPVARIQTYLDDAGIDLILTTRDAFSDRLRSELKPRQVIFVEDVVDMAIEPVVPETIDPHQLAAILYTSGSTGMPKGVMHSHRTLMETVRIKGNELGYSPSDRIGGMSTFTFGSYYVNVFGAMLTGATLHLYDFYRFPFEGLKSWLTDRCITHFHCTPTTLRQFLVTLDRPTGFPDLRLVSLGGEMVYPGDVYQFQEKLSHSTPLCTTGAAIETWFYACTFFQTPFPDGIDQIPMGYIHPDCHVDIRDDDGRILPPGEIGEITVSTDCLSPGYWKRPELNAAKYAEGEGERRYFRTGDLGLFTPDGLLYPKGRTDFQVKIRGIRVDLGEIEATLHDHPAVKQAVVVARTRQDNQTELIAYVVTAGDRAAPRRELYEFLADRLPPYQIPARLVELESFPLTRTHKIDRNALPDPDAIPVPGNPDRVDPRDETEAIIFSIWVDSLGHENFGVTERFLEIGGDSLSAMRIRHAIEAACGVALALPDFVTAATIERLAHLVQVAQNTRAETHPSNPPESSTGPNGADARRSP